MKEVYTPPLPHKHNSLHSFVCVIPGHWSADAKAAVYSPLFFSDPYIRTVGFCFSQVHNNIVRRQNVPQQSVLPFFEDDLSRQTVFPHHQCSLEGRSIAQGKQDLFVDKK